MATATIENTPVIILKLSLNEAKFLKMLTQNSFFPGIDKEPPLENSARQEIFKALHDAGI